MTTNDYVTQKDQFILITNFSDDIYGVVLRRTTEMMLFAVQHSTFNATSLVLGLMHAIISVCRERIS